MNACHEPCTAVGSKPECHSCRRFTNNCGGSCSGYNTESKVCRACGATAARAARQALNEKAATS